MNLLLLLKMASPSNLWGSSVQEQQPAFMKHSLCLHIGNGYVKSQTKLSCQCDLQRDVESIQF